jgi:hypothetical protein
MLVDCCSAPSISNTVATLVMAIKVQEQLLAWEREQDSKEGTLMAQKGGIVAFKCVLGRACTECDTESDKAEAI